MVDDREISERLSFVIMSNMENIMKHISKLALALAGVAGLALSAESAQAQLVLNGTGSSAGRLFAGNSPALVCDAAPTPLLFVSSEGTPNKYEWQCTINGVANSRVRYSATNSSDGFEKQPIGIGQAVYLNTAGCPAGVATTILGRTVLRSVCSAATPTQTLTVHWGGSDVEASSLKQNAGGVGQNPPPAAHLITEPTVIVPFAIVVGRDVLQAAPATPLASLTLSQLRQVLDPPVAGNNWTTFGYDTRTANKAITVCQRQGGSGTIAALDQTVMQTPFWGTPTYRGVSNPSSSNVITCINSNPNSIGYIDSDSVNATNFPAVGGVAPYQIQIGGYSVNAGALGTGKARLNALRCGRYPYWANWNFITRSAGTQAPPINAVAGTDAAISDLQISMVANNPLPDFWASLDNMFVNKLQDRGPIFYQTLSTDGLEVASNVCN